MLVHDFSGTLAEMGDGVLVTADHRILQNGEWVRAGDIFKGARRYEGVVMNLSVETEPQDRENSPQSEHSYTLSNGWVAHNTVKY